MNKVIRFFKRRSWLVILLACLLFIPQSFSYQAKLNMRVIVTGLAIDTADEGYEVTAQVVMPSPSSESGGTSARLDFISEKGASVDEGIQKIAYKIGKEAGLSHTDFIMLGEEILKKNVAPVLDFFARDDQVSPAILLLGCEGKAKDTMKQTKNLELLVAVGLQQVFIFKQSSLNGISTAVDDFINDCYDISASSVISSIKIAPEGKEDESASSRTNDNGNLASEGQSEGSQGGSNGGSSGEEKNARIKFFNDVFYFKDGKLVGKLDKEDEILGLFFANKKSTNGNFKVAGITQDVLDNATVGIQFSNKKTKFKVDFVDDKPRLKFDITLGSIRLDEILNGDNASLSLYDKQNSKIRDAIKKAVKKEVEKCIKSTFDKAQADNVDIFHIAESCYQYKTKEWKKFYENEGENYLQKCSIEVEVKIKDFN